MTVLEAYMNAQLSNQFIHVIISGDIERVKQFINSGIDVNEYDSSRRLPIFIASLYGHTEIVKELIRAGADVNKGTNSEWKPIYIASANGYHDTVRTLTAAGADVNIITPNIGAPIHIASRRGHIYVVRALIDAKADVNIKDVYYKRTPILLASMNGFADIVRELIHAGADISIKDKDGQTALDIAKNNEIKEILMSVSEEKQLGVLEEIDLHHKNKRITDPLSITAEYVTGRKGSLAEQRNKLKQTMGVSLAPRSRGGYRKTRKNNRKRRFVKTRK